MNTQLVEDNTLAMRKKIRIIAFQLTKNNNLQIQILDQYLSSPLDYHRDYYHHFYHYYLSISGFFFK